MTGGLKAGEKIIVEGAQNLRGTNIKVEPKLMTMEEAEAIPMDSEPVKEEKNGQKKTESPTLTKQQ